MANNRIAGLAYLKVDGAQYALRGNLSVSPVRTVRTGVAGQDGVHGYTEAPTVPYIEGDVSDLGGLSLERLHAVADATVTAELANGKVYLLRQAWFAGEMVLNTVEGSMPVRFEGMSCEEIA
jgi:hypothetical protein